MAENKIQKFMALIPIAFHRLIFFFSFVIYFTTQLHNASPTLPPLNRQKTQKPKGQDIESVKLVGQK